VSDIGNVASELAIMRAGKLVAFETPAAILAKARGQVWSASVGAAHYAALRARVHVLHAQRQGDTVALRIAHAGSFCDGARAAEPSLEEALMAQRYAVREAA
jgi:ABC-2 type transport system ATP-binding protein